MEAISLTSKSALRRKVNVAKLLARKAAECVLSMSAVVVLGVVAVMSLFAYYGMGEQHRVLVVPTVVWVLHLCAVLAIDVMKGGDL